jgi:hypothetical protein
MRDQLVEALANGQGVTAKVRWLTVSHRRHGNRSLRKTGQLEHPLEAHLEAGDQDDEAEDTGRLRWLHCTPLVGSNGSVGVWMVVIIDEETDPSSHHSRHISVPERIRPESAMSDRSIDDKSLHNTSNAASASPTKPKLRPRRSSDTLGFDSSKRPLRNEDPSITKAIHQQHSLNSLRAPARPTLQSPGVAARFYNAEALSLATQTGFSTQQRRQGSRSPRPREEERSDTPQTWPMPPSSPAGIRRNREAGVRVPSMIRETSSERAVVWGSRSDGDASSIVSQSSAFTVRIEED